MKQMKVSFKTPNEVLDFVNKVTKYPFDIDMKRGHIFIDAKSILGIMGLGIGESLELLIHDENCRGLERDIQPFLMA